MEWEIEWRSIYSLSASHIQHLTLLVVRSPGGGAGHGPGHAQRPLQPDGHHLGQEEGRHDEPHLQHGDHSA